MRLMKGLRLRIKNVEFDRWVVVVRLAKGNKDRVVRHPGLCRNRLRSSRARSSRRRGLWSLGWQSTKPEPLPVRAFFWGAWSLVYFLPGGKSVQLPCATSAAMPMLSPSVGCG